MQCPRCGFENMPGRQECAVCSTQLTSAAQRESVMPPRAKNRTFGERARWRVNNNHTISAANEKVHGAERSFSNSFGRSLDRARITWSWITPRNLWLLLISIIPGLGYIFGKKDKQTGIRFLYGSLAALLLALATYRTFIADILVGGVAAASVISIFAAADSIIPASRDERRCFLSRAGITLLVISAVCTGFFLIVTAPGFPVSQATVIAQPLINLVTTGDSLILWNGGLNRGDIVVGHMVADQAGIGIVAGVPGDRVQVSPDGTVYLNGRQLQLPPPDPNMPANQNSVHSYKERIIPRDEFLITQTILGYIGHYYDNNLHSISEMGYVERENIQGRVIAVTWPPSHRKLIRSGHLNEE